jgi:hypothetical protein
MRLRVEDRRLSRNSAGCCVGRYGKDTENGSEGDDSKQRLSNIKGSRDV